MAGKSETPMDIVVAIVNGMTPDEAAETLRRIMALPVCEDAVKAFFVESTAPVDEGPDGTSAPRWTADSARRDRRGGGGFRAPFWMKRPDGIDPTKKGGFRILGEFCRVADVPDGTLLLVGLKGAVKEYAVGLRAAGEVARPFCAAPDVEVRDFRTIAAASSWADIEAEIARRVLPA